MMEDDQAETLYKDYTATYIGVITRAILSFGRADAEIPSYIELAHPQTKKEDERTGGEIIDSLVERLTK